MAGTPALVTESRAGRSTAIDSKYEQSRAGCSTVLSSPTWATKTRSGAKREGDETPVFFEIRNTITPGPSPLETVKEEVPILL